MTQAMQYWSISSQELSQEAKTLWLKVDVVSQNDNLFYVSSNSKKILFKSTDFWGNSALWLKICNDKWLTYKVLEHHNLPTAKSIYISKESFEKNKNIEASSLLFPVIIKPLDEAHWNGVMMNILDNKELSEKLESSFELYENMIIQEQIKWDEVRVLVVKWNVILARNRIPAQVIWDGIHNIEELIEIENNTNSFRWEGYELPLANIKIDNELLSYISKQWLNLNDTPQKDSIIQLRGNSNIGTWGTMINVTDVMHPETKEICIKSAQALWLEIAWVDILAEDISKPLHTQWGIILEVNATPWLWWEKELTGVNTAREILKRVFELQN